MLFKIASKAEKQSMLNVEEAFGLWDITTTKYNGIDMIQIWVVQIWMIPICIGHFSRA